ncbi:HEAT repeat domain-containing protein [Embleya sp. NBC_00888]|uniref:hypothetical protein n=1 Tax=Embleya sp. NBC_00888 TaxID=2975960 RepID=UPI00386CCF3B|nr:HEAT repeat domain-containing protein [Embleya sp. NBC_00888]
MQVHETCYDRVFLQEGGYERCRGTDLDVRVVMARMPVDVKDGFRYERVPWERFFHPFGRGEDIPGLLKQLRFADDEEAAERALGELWSLRHQHQTSAPAPLAVPFLLRIAADRSTYWRSGVLSLVAHMARSDHSYHVVEIRTEFFRVAYRDDDLRYDTNMYPQNWSIQAARDAIAADAQILLNLLDDPDPDVRGRACHVLSAASGKAREISIALHERLGVEDDPQVRARIVLALAQLAREHAKIHADTVAWARACWADATRPAEVRVSALLAWSCLVEGPLPDALRAVLEETVTEELDRLMSPIPWLEVVDEAGLPRILERILQAEEQDLPALLAARDRLVDPWIRGCDDDPPF